MNSKEMVKAARILATCPKERIPLIVKILKEAGVDVGEAEVAAIETGRNIEARLRTNRANEYRKNWIDTDDEFVLFMRKAFEDGIDFGMIRKITGLNKSTIYRCMWGERKGTPSTREAIRSAIETLYAKRENREAK